MAKGKPKRDGVDVESDEGEYYLDDLYQAVETYEDFVLFVLALHENWQRHGTARTSWTNTDMESYLGAIAHLSERCGAEIDAYEPGESTRNPWKVAAMLLYNARVSSPG